MDFQGAQSQKEGQEDQEEDKELVGTPPLAVVRSPGPPVLPLGSLEIHQAIPTHQAILI